MVYGCLPLHPSFHLWYVLNPLWQASPLPASKTGITPPAAPKTNISAHSSPASIPTAIIISKEQHSCLATPHNAKTVPDTPGTTLSAVHTVKQETTTNTTERPAFNTRSKVNKCLGTTSHNDFLVHFNKPFQPLYNNPVQSKKASSLAAWQTPHKQPQPANEIGITTRQTKLSRQSLKAYLATSIATYEFFLNTNTTCTPKNCLPLQKTACHCYKLSVTSFHLLSL